MKRRELLSKFLRYTKLSEKAYERFAKDDKIEVNGIFYQVYSAMWDKPTSTTAYILRKKGTTKFVIAFKGSQEVKDFLIDASAWKRDWNFTKGLKGIRVHAGFHKAYSAIREKLIREIVDLNQRFGYGLTITLCGHSLGGALTNVALLDLLSLFPESKLSAYSVEAPRVFNKPGRDYLNKHSDYFYRIMYDRDLVPNIPKINYWHAGKLWRFLGDGRVTDKQPYLPFFMLRFSHHPIAKIKFALIEAVDIETFNSMSKGN